MMGKEIFWPPFHFGWTAYSGRWGYVSVLYGVPPGWERKKFEEGDGLLSDAPSVYIDVVGLCWAVGAGRSRPGKVRHTKPDQAQVQPMGARAALTLNRNRAAAVFGRAGTNANCTIYFIYYILSF
jgi:hypothetical protein